MNNNNNEKMDIESKRREVSLQDNLCTKHNTFKCNN